MRVIHGTTEFGLENSGKKDGENYGSKSGNKDGFPKSAVAFGKFDGIHLGHQKLLRCILERKKQGLLAVVFTFDPPPSTFFGNGTEKELMTAAEKRAAFEKMGVDVLVEFPLTPETAATAPEDFITGFLQEKLHTAYLAAGADVSFGSRGAGNAALLHAMAGKCGFEVHIIDKVCYNGKVVSSTGVRQEVERGRMEEAACLLGAPYGIWGTVMHGNRFGRTIGMPTVNLLPPGNKLLPPNGVYYSRVFLEGREWQGITNIGCKPTVSNDGRMGVETYIYGFEREIYGMEIGVSLLGFKRPEMKFHGKNELKEQMARDIAQGRRYHGLQGLEKN